MAFDRVRQMRNSGYYPVRMDAEELRQIADDEARRDQLFTETMLETLRSWLSLAEERLRDRAVRMIVTPGNDDELVVDEVLREAPFITAPEGMVTTIDRYQMLSVGWSNPTPWDTPRECSEDELTKKIGTLARQIDDMSTAIFNIHVPPFGTGLDDAPELDQDLRPVRGGAVMKGCGEYGDPGRDPRIPAVALASRAHPRVSRGAKAWAHDLHQPRQHLRRLGAAGRHRRPQPRPRQALRAHGRMTPTPLEVR
jgi:hypothetical protein